MLHNTIARTVLLVFIAGDLCSLIAQSSRDAESINRLLDRAMAASETYSAVFRDLTAEEDRVSEKYQKNGKMAQSRRTVSDVLIHGTPSTAAGEMRFTEYRSVREVDGKPIKDAKDRVTRLSAELSQRPVQAQFEEIRKESVRYDLRACAMNGMTLKMGNISFVHRKDARSFFEFKIVGSERIQEHDLDIVSYLQTAKAPGVNINVNPEHKPPIARTFVRGRLWIDPESGYIWREETDIMAQPVGSTEPVVMFQNSFEYAPSRFGIPVPSLISLSCHLRFSNTKPPRTSLTGRVIARYGAFQRFRADVELKAPEN